MGDGVEVLMPWRRWMWMKGFTREDEEGGRGLWRAG